MSEFCPDGVSYFSYKPQSSKGSKQPAAVKAGQPAVDKISGGSKGKGASVKAAANGLPGGVRQNAGTEDRGSKPRTKQGSGAGPGKPKGAGATPAVNKYRSNQV